MAVLGTFQHKQLVTDEMIDQLWHQFSDPDNRTVSSRCGAISTTDSPSIRQGIQLRFERTIMPMRVLVGAGCGLPEGRAALASGRARGAAQSILLAGSSHPTGATIA